MLPTTTGIIEFRPAAERVAAARQAVEDARPDNVATDAAQTVLAALEAASDPVYSIRVPTIRSKINAAADVMAEACPRTVNSKLLAAVLAGEMDADDREFVAGIVLGENEAFPVGSWSRFCDIARTVPASARAIANNIKNHAFDSLHKIRWHLVIEGQRSPLPEVAIDALPPEDAAAIAEKIDDLMFPSVDEAKNSVAP